MANRTKVISAVKGWQSPLRHKDSVFASQVKEKKGRGKSGKTKTYSTYRTPK